MSEGVTTENVSVDTETTQGNIAVTTENTEIDQETESQSGASVDNESEVEEVEETLEERLSRLEKDNEIKNRRIERQKAANRAAQEALERQRREYEALLKNIKQAEATGEPKQDDFDSYEEYDKARIEYRANLKVKELEAQIYQKKIEEQKRAQMAEMEAKRVKQESEYVAINPNYKESKAEFVEFIKTVNVSEDVEQAIVRAAYKGNIAQIIDYFGSNGGEKLGELEQIIKMDPIDAAIAIYEIQQGLKTPIKQELKPLPKPATKLKATATATKSPSKMSGKELLKRMKVNGY